MPDEQPEKLDLTSMDIAARKRLELKQLFPEVFTETRKDDGTIVEAVDFERLKTALGEFSDILERQRERYGMVWPGKNECQKIIQQPSLATLKPDRDESVNFNETDNLFIEGDNLEVLKLLQKSYYGKVKMIYIDPPYNTGNDFVYPDDYSESLDTYLKYAGLADDEGKKFESKANVKDSARFHTQWLSMMYPRLYLAKNLLHENGAIFISIDDNEITNLRNLCNEVFGEENFYCSFVWQRRSGAMDSVDNVSQDHEYVVCYAKTKSKLNGIARTYKKYSNPDNDPRGPWILDNLSAGKAGGDVHYPIIDPATGNEYLPPEGRYWPYNRETMKRKISEGRIIFPKKPEGRPMLKRFSREAKSESVPVSTWLRKRGDKATANSIFSALNTEGTKESQNILGGKYFSHPKPTQLIKSLTTQILEPKDIVVDFFAGSCSSADAVLNLNQEDGGNRKFIMVQLPEPCSEDSEAAKAGFKTIADIGKERIRRVIRKIESEQKGQLNLEDKPKPDLGFKVFKLARSNFKVWDSEPKNDTEAIKKQIELNIDHIDPKASQEDILYELLLKAGFPLTAKIEKRHMAEKDVFAIEGGTLLICLEKRLTSELIRAMAEANPRQVICLDEGFEGNDQLKTNAVQTFRSRSQGDGEPSQIVFRTV